MNPFAQVEARVRAIVADWQASGRLPGEALPLSKLTVEPPKDPSHGDASTNAALILSKSARSKPLDLAQGFAEELRATPGVTGAATAGPGFVNLTFAPDVWLGEVRDAIRQGVDYGRPDLGQGRPINVEYCSANPTGPLHVGHGRGTVFGDALANLLAAAGFEVTREYYVNDGGAQIDVLARSVHHRYRELLGQAVGELPEGCYPGDYLIPVAQAIVDRDGDRWSDEPEPVWLEVFRERAIAAMIELIKQDLATIGVHHDRFSSEAALLRSNRLAEVFDKLQAKQLLYRGTLPPPKGKPIEDWEPREQLLFKTKSFGDDTDRPLQRSNDEWTYFASDLAYHWDKIDRGFDQMVLVVGADHGGYVKRMKAAVAAMSDETAEIDVKLCQLVNLMDDGQPLRMSKRAGRIVTLGDVVAEVGADVLRFIMLTRRNDAPLDFDLTKVTEQSKDNPVFYVQYAHARICSVFRKAEQAGIDVSEPDLAEARFDLLTDEGEIAVARQIALYPRTLIQAVEHREPHRIAFYLEELAATSHRLWSRGKEEPDLRFLRDDAPDLTRARLGLLWAVRNLLASGLGIIGVTPVEEMHRAMTPEG
ncbi:MAG: arginine--tRNA ligase [Geminicoccaceae bacterium]